jgi:hypothetical protein
LPELSFLASLANVILDWKILAGEKRSSLLGHLTGDEEESFRTSVPDHFAVLQRSALRLLPPGLPAVDDFPPGDVSRILLLSFVPDEELY